MIRDYEVVMLLEPTLDEKLLDDFEHKVEETIQNSGGEVGKVNKLGKRVLAYQIKQYLEAHYMVLTASLDTSHLANLERSLGLFDEVIRHKVIRLPNGFKISGLAKRIR
ncbi:MAG: 30S ribosomal protein S6 [Actinobacteria bacterium]|nr:30S ribosomal protein S6 [Actinomycetota bacterium]MCL6104265.1 30S ribosomal protein S6 [Actinomycetota bacterium]